MSTPLFRFEARVITGSGRGKRLQVPTINVELADLPTDMQEGIYACSVALLPDTADHPASMHFGPRPVFHDSPTCEVHLLDQTIEKAPDRVRIEVIEHLRPVQDFPSPEALLRQIADDNKRARAILNAE